MTKITLNNVVSLPDYTTAQTTINNNSDVIETAFDNTLSRNGTAPNQMTAPFDMNSNQILNLPAPITVNSPLRLQDLTDFTGTGVVHAIPAGGTTGQALEKSSGLDYAVQWSNTVNSVGLALPADFTITNSPVTTTGTLTGAWATTPTGTGAIVRKIAPTLTSPILTTPDLGTPSAINLNNATNLPIGSIAGLGTNVGPFLAIPTSGNLANAIVDETGSGSLVFGTTPTISTPNIIGVTSGSAVAAGSVGEVISSTVLQGSAVSLTTATPATITSIVLTAGVWEISSQPAITGSAATLFQGIRASISTTTATENLVAPFFTSSSYANQSVVSTYNWSRSISPIRVNISSGATYFLVINATFTTNVASGFGGIRAIRVI